MDAFIYKLAIIFIPGIMGRFLLDRLLFIKDRDKFYFILNAFLLGVFSYIIFDLATRIIEIIFSPALKYSSLFSVTASILDLTKTEPVNILIILCVAMISLGLSICWATLEKKRYLTGILQRLGVTNRFPEPDIWNHLFNSPTLYVNSWVVVRDRKYDLAYQGKLRLFSDTSTVPELLLIDVIVFRNSTGEQLNSVNELYLALERERIEIECLPNLTTPVDCAIMEKNEERKES